ncbi:MAG: zinc-ribbon domain-containing protein, partial [Acidobacteriota bacterium]|nr:zinc-ribbon domain-containing protein [Acidobacteriota bacterium]
MEDLLVVGFVLIVLFILITLIGHGIWVVLRWVIRRLFDTRSSKPEVQGPVLSRCSRCGAPISPNITFCGHCGAPRPSGIVVELLKDLAGTERQLERFRRAGAVEDSVYDDLKNRIQAERIKLSKREAAAPVTPAAPVLEPAVIRQPPSVTDRQADEPIAPEVTIVPPSVVVASEITTASSAVIDVDKSTVHAEERVFAREARFKTDYEQQSPPPPAAEPRRPFTEVLAAFMEQSNIRWGEIIGGLLIIGCSTALVVSLWAQISSIPVLKFLIFTTVTAALFGVGLYTEHRWKLPTTSRGILTIATLLVPLNFLAIAAVSGGTASQGSLVVGSELIAPALFLCLVYFAGRVITPKWPHLLAAGVLGSSVGQLLIRHFAAPDNSPGLLLALGAVPVICYAGTAAWMLWIALADSEIDESETVAIFITLGALTFAALLPFGLLLYKGGPVSMTMMYLAPLVTLGGVPMLASGTLMWKRVRTKELVTSRMAGTAIAILGTVVVMAGMILAWPNPASIVPAAILNFAVLTALAVLLDLSLAHVLAAICFSLAYVVLFHVVTGHIPWQNLRIVSLVDVTTSAGSGQALVLLFALYIASAEWLAAKKRRSDSVSYLIAACAVAVVSLVCLTRYGFNLPGDPYGLWICYLIYALGAFWLARRKLLPIFGGIGSGLLLVSLFHALGPWLGRSFPWQTALLLEASVCAVLAIIGSRYCEFTRRTIVRPLNSSALIASFAALLCLLQANTWETTGMQAERVLWLAGIWFVLLWLNRDWKLFTVFQIGLTGGVVLAIKAALQQYEWYAYLPHAFLHPTALQIQGTALVLLSLVWVGVRYLMSEKGKFADPGNIGTSNEPRGDSVVAAEHWTKAARRLLDIDFAFDRLVTWAVLGAFTLLILYGAFSGVKQELTAMGNATPAWNVVGFPHQAALGPGSWILLSLLVIAMLANLWERRHAEYLLGALVALVLICPLLAGRWELQIATASAWRWFAAIFLVLGSVPLWFRERFGSTNFRLSWYGQEADSAEQQQAGANRTLVRRTRVLLLAATLAPLLILTAYPALRAIYYMPVHGPSSGVFFALGDSLSYSVPLVLAALTLIGYALRERLLTYGFAAGLLFNLTLTMVYLLSLVSVHASMDRVVTVHVLHLNAISAALYAIVWLSMHPRWARRLSAELGARAVVFLGFHLAIAIAG